MLRLTVFAIGLLTALSAFAQSKPVGERVKVNGMQMYYEVSGQGEPLIVLHGACMNILQMGAINAVAAEFRKRLIRKVSPRS